ncbi:MAG: DUF2272 domain-containing protein [Phormidesmis sp. RL_2_1]|nr:DUF2272 domain-containing protein [Phormidesmis sp. RL_2_1]
MAYLTEEDIRTDALDFEDELDWLEDDELDWFEDGDQDWLDDELERFIAPLYNKIKSALLQGKEALTIRLAIGTGNRDENQLTNLIFFNRHPERQGQKLSPKDANFQALSREWLDIRNQLVRPLLKQISPTTVTTGSSAASRFKQRLKDIAFQEHLFFDKGKKKEHQQGAWQRVGQYWKEGVGQNLDGRDRNVPWSAAFISWVMRKAGAGNRFKYSASHSVYIRDAIKKRKQNDPSAAFKGYRPQEVAPQVGDLVCYARAANVNYDTTSSYPSHCDIVVAKRSGKIDVIGGNVSDSVTKRTLNVNSQGKLTDSSRPWFVVIKTLL